MNLKYYYYYFQNALTPRFCDELIEYGKSSKKKLGLTGFNEEQAEELKKKNKTEYKKYLNNVIKKRNSNVVWLNDRWIYKEIQPYVYKANKLAGWNFHWDYSENCQFTIYKKNQFYEWHNDAFEEPFNEIENKNKHGKIRKLSVTCSLSDPKDYEGGELEFDFRNVSPDKPTPLLSEYKYPVVVPFE